jgi:hypothetical protein
VGKGSGGLSPILQTVVALYSDGQTKGRSARREWACSAVGGTSLAGIARAGQLHGLAATMVRPMVVSVRSSRPEEQKRKMDWEISRE